MSATPELRRFDFNDVEAVAGLALANDSAGLDGFVERALHDLIPIGAVLLELIAGADRWLARGYEEHRYGMGQLSVALGALRLCALKWSPELPRRSSLDAGRLFLIEVPGGRPSTTATLYSIYGDCSGWTVESWASRTSPRPTDAAAAIVVDSEAQLAAAKKVYDQWPAGRVCLALGPSMSADDEKRTILSNPGQLPTLLRRLEEKVRRSSM